ncbi:MAG: hypothetical protein J7K61_04205 [Thermoplasmata archaeon]|nr:hypothetical protein [Thermoplasmata archaeon]
MTATLTNLLIPLGILPAIVSIYIMVGGYDGRFREKLVLFSFIGGMALGLLLYILTAYSFPSPYIDEIILYSLIYTFTEFLEKLAFLKLKFFNDNGLPIYGGSIGAGMAAIFAPVFIKELDFSLAAIMFAIVPIAIVFISTSTGIMVGAGIKRERKYFLYSFMISLLAWIFLIISMYDIRFFFLPMIMAIATYYLSLKRVLPLSMLKRAELRKML